MNKGLLALCLVLVMAACGGGDGADTDSSSPSDAPAEKSSAAAPDAGPPAPTGTATISGSVTFEGDPPKPPVLRMDADPACASKHSAPVYSEMLSLGEGNTLGNVFVSIKSGLAEGAHSVPSEPAVIDQNGCLYKPHVLGVRLGQTLLIKNSDSVLHNVHSLSKINSPFNRAMPGSVTEARFTFDKQEGMFRIKCDVHPWMSAFVGVLPHPYFAVTGPDGSFEISGLPAGTYEVEAWHERMGTRTGSVTINDGASANVDFGFSP